MGYKIYLRNIKPTRKKIRTPWFTWIKWGIFRTYRNNPKYVLQDFVIAGLYRKNKIHDFGLLQESVERYQPKLRKQFIIVEKKNPYIK